MAMRTPIRLQKYLSQCGIASRRKAEELIQQGKVEVDGHTVTDMGIRIVPGKNIIRCGGRPVVSQSRMLYILLNKPKGYVTTMADPQGRPIVTTLLKDIPERLFPVGRLDIDTEGALILTNDGNLAQRIQHPSHETTKTYEALVVGHPQRSLLAQLEKGVVLEGKLTAPARIAVRKTAQRSTFIEIIIHEGRKRQVRKMFEAIGHPVLHLKRIAYGKLFLEKLPIGKFRILGPHDIEKIFL